MRAKTRRLWCCWSGDVKLNHGRRRSDSGSRAIRRWRCSVVVAGYGGLNIISALCWPEWFLDTLAINYIQANYMARKGTPNIPCQPWYFWPLSLFTIVAVGILVYFATDPLIAFVPHSWGAPGEDGEWQSAQDYLRFTMTLFGSLGLVSRLERNAEVLVWGPQERKAREALTDAIRFAHPRSTETTENMVRKVDEKLEVDPNSSASFGHQYATDLHRRIRDILGL